MAPTILLAEDDPAVAAMLRDALELKGYCVQSVDNGADLEATLKAGSPDLIILDLLLPDTSGLVLYFDIKAAADVPVIVCSGTKRKEDSVLALRLGADDFIAKPFEIQELQARVEAVLRRTLTRGQGAPSEEAPEHFGNLVVDRTRCKVVAGDRELQLTPTEYRLLSLLISRADQVMSKKDLAEPVWGSYDPDVGRTLDVHIRRLRAKVRSAEPGAPEIETVRGFGYRLLENA
jgi:DNA-binding response OmpR family regulator